MRYFLELSFNGSSFHGWQIQPNAISVQAVLENSLSLILGSDISVVGAGRTDAGVHARKMFAHFDSPLKIEDEDRFVVALNSLCGPNIKIMRIISVQENDHARFDATSRTYKYFVTFDKNPFLYKLCWKSAGYLDIDLMNQACLLIKDNKDFTSFAKLHSDAKTNICNVTKAEWNFLKEDPEAQFFMGNLDNGIVFTITADRFLRNMVRAIVGTLVEIGRHKISLQHLQKIIDDRNRCSAGTSMPPEALFLWDVTYPFI